ncbi:MAG: hypothetical protein V3G42_05380 [Oscillospiraceae bacterium]
MIKVHFFDYGCGSLNVEHELMLSEGVDDFLIRQLPELRLEATDNLNDMEDNEIYWFSAVNEKLLCSRIIDLLEAILSKDTNMKYTVSVTSDDS